MNILNRPLGESRKANFIETPISTGGNDGGIHCPNKCPKCFTTNIQIVFCEGGERVHFSICNIQKAPRDCFAVSCNTCEYEWFQAQSVKAEKGISETQADNSIALEAGESVTGTLGQTTEINAAEAVYGFAAWLTTRNDTVVFGATNDCAIASELVNEFCLHNEFALPRNGYENNFLFPTVEDAAKEKNGWTTIRKQMAEIESAEEKQKDCPHKNQYVLNNYLVCKDCGLGREESQKNSSDKKNNKFCSCDMARGSVASPDHCVQCHLEIPGFVNGY